MREFRTCRVVKVYCVEGLGGYWSKITATEARQRPDAERAKLGKSVRWFVPAEHDDFYFPDLSDLESEELNNNDLSDFSSII